MPELSRFEGMVIQMYYDDRQKHNLPHIHVIYAESIAVYSLTGKRLEGRLPQKKEHLIKSWIYLRQAELQAAWEKAVKNTKPAKIKPLS